MERVLYINSEKMVLGRLGSAIAPQLLNGYEIHILNAEKAIISGDKHSIINAYKEKLKIQTHTTPWKGPFHYRKPDRFVKRSIRGMLPWKKPRGKEAYKRLKVYIGVPHELKEKSFTAIPEALVDRQRHGFITIGDLCKQIGWNPKGETT